MMRGSILIAGLVGDTAPGRDRRLRATPADAGHMMYLHEPSLRKYRDDLVGFIKATSRL